MHATDMPRNACVSVRVASHATPDVALVRAIPVHAPVPCVPPYTLAVSALHSYRRCACVPAVRRRSYAVRPRRAYPHPVPSWAVVHAPTVRALIDCLNQFDVSHFDPKTIRTHAEKFDTRVFQDALKQHILTL